MQSEECEYLTALYADLIQENMVLLKEYHTVLKARDMGKVEAMRDAIEGAEKFRKIGRDGLLADRATHRKILTAKNNQ